MKKFIFAALAVVALVSCDPTVKEGKCTDLSELKEAVLNNSTDTARFDLNGDGEINVADINMLINNSAPADSTKVECDEADSI